MTQTLPWQKVCHEKINSMNSSVAKIKERLSIEEVVSSYIKLDRAGANLKARCPFHNEKTPSFFVSPDRGSYYCFGCGVKGDIFTFVEEFEGLDFRGALKLLADRAGVVLESFNPKDQKNQSEKEKLYKVMEEASVFFEKNLRENTEVLAYLKNRGLNDESIKDFRIGFAKLEWRELYFFLQKKGFKDIEMEKAGLIKHPLPTSPEGGGEPSPLGRVGRGYDRFRGRIMFPISDSSGRVIAFSGRIFVDDGKSAKYLNSPETPIFHKSSVLYGIDKAKSFIKKNDFSIVVEGQFDLILSHQAGYKNTIATSGTSLTEQVLVDGKILNNFGMISRLSNNIIFVFDYDKAGFNASIKAAKIALDLDMNVKAINMPPNTDPAEFIFKKGVNAWKDAIKEAKHIIEFLFKKYIPSSKKTDLLTIKLEISKNIIPVLNHIKNPIKRSHFLSTISHYSGIKVEDITEIANKDLSENTEELINKKITDSFREQYRKNYIERRLLGIAFWQESMETRKIDPELIFKKLIKVKEKYKDIKEDLIYEVEEFYSNNENLDKDVNEMLLNIEEEYLNEELTKNMMELQNLKGKEEEMEIFKKINEINKKKEDIKNSRIHKDSH